MSLMESANELLDSIVEMPFRFAEVVTTHLASGDPVTAAVVALLMAFGALFVGLSVGVFGYLTVGGVVSFLSVERSTAPPR
ncbi:MAG: hypothetical protein V5A28_11865 [Haloarculaceae archaeon]